MQRRLKTATQIVTLTAALTVLPSAAHAVSVNASFGTGIQLLQTKYNNGAAVTGQLSATQGYPVFYEGRIN